VDSRRDRRKINPVNHISIKHTKTQFLNSPTLSIIRELGDDKCELREMWREFLDKWCQFGKLISTQADAPFLEPLNLISCRC